MNRKINTFILLASAAVLVPIFIVIETQEKGFLDSFLLIGKEGTIFYFFLTALLAFLIIYQIFKKPIK